MRGSGRKKEKGEKAERRSAGGIEKGERVREQGRGGREREEGERESERERGSLRSD